MTDAHSPRSQTGHADAATGAAHDRLSALPPVIRADTRAVVLGSFPGAASLQAQQYYAHPRNQFWPILGTLLGEPLPELPYAERLRTLLEHRVGLWDVYASCRRKGSLDTAIRDAVPNELDQLRAWAPDLRLVLHNGAESARRIREIEALGLAAIRVPSTSPANARLSLEAKLCLWREALVWAGVLLAET